MWGNSTVSTKLLPIVDWTAAHKMLPLSSDDAISDDKMLTLSLHHHDHVACAMVLLNQLKALFGVTAFLLIGEKIIIIEHG